MQRPEPGHSPYYALGLDGPNLSSASGEAYPWLDFCDLITTDFNSVEQDYVPLLQGLPKLPSLETTSYAGHAIGHGFCAVSAATMLAHAKARDGSQALSAVEIQPEMHWALRTVWWSDAEVFTAILASLGHEFKNEEILQPMPAVSRRCPRALRVSSNFRESAPSQAPACEQTIHVKITAPGPCGWNAFLGCLLSKMPAVEALDVELTSSMEETTWHTLSDISYDTLPVPVRWERGRDTTPCALRNLAKGSQLESITVPNQSRLPYSLNDADVVNLLSRHKASLRHVHFENTTFFNFDLIDDIPFHYDLRGGMWDVVACIKNELDLQSAKLVVSQPGCTDECNVSMAGEEHRFCDGHFIKDGWAHAATPDGLATHIEAETGDGSFDFATKIGSDAIS